MNIAIFGYLNKLNRKYFYTNEETGYMIENKNLVKRKRKVIKAQNYNEELQDNSKRLIHKYLNK